MIIITSFKNNVFFTLEIFFFTKMCNAFTWQGQVNCIADHVHTISGFSCYSDKYSAAQKNENSSLEVDFKGSPLSAAAAALVLAISKVALLKHLFSIQNGALSHVCKSIYSSLLGDYNFKSELALTSNAGQ